MLTFQETLSALVRGEREVNASGVKWSDGEIKNYSNALQRSKTQKLWLSGCSVSDVGAKALAFGLGSNRSLQILNLSLNNIGDSGTKALASVLENNRFLTVLHLEDKVIMDNLDVNMTEEVGEEDEEMDFSSSILN